MLDERRATAGNTARALGYDPANAMVRASLLWKDESAVPCLFSLWPELPAGTTADSGPAEP